MLKIANNPLICDYGLCWIRMWPWMFDTQLLADTATCASPSGVAGKPLTHWGRMTQINIGSVNGLSPGRRQAIIWTNAGILLIEPLGTNFSGILSEIHPFSFKKIHLKMSSGKWRPFCLGPNVLMEVRPVHMECYDGKLVVYLLSKYFSWALKVRCHGHIIWIYQGLNNGIYFADSILRFLDQIDWNVISMCYYDHSV